MNDARRVAVTGLGCLSAAGPDVPSSLAALFAGRRAPAPPLTFHTNHQYPFPVFAVPDAFFLSPLPGEEMLLRTARLALTASWEAVENAGWEPDELHGRRWGVVLGTTVGSSMNNEEVYRGWREGEKPGLEPIHRFLRSNPAAVVSAAFGLTGPVQTVVNACSSGTDAVGIGASWIRRGLCEGVLAGGADELCRVIYNGFASLMIADTNPCRPFDRDRRGLNLGEGAGVLVLESEACRRRRGGRARAVVLGYGTAADAYHLTAPHPDGAGLRRAIGAALAEAALPASGVAFVNAHGTATPDNDRVEGKVLHDLFPGVPYGSTKGYTGHTLGAAGGIEAVFTVACLEAGRIPATAGFANPDPAIPDSPVAAVTAVAGEAALSTSLAFGGNNAAVIFGQGDRG